MRINTRRATTFSVRLMGNQMLRMAGLKPAVYRFRSGRWPRESRPSSTAGIACCC
ncbi:hypothetical protein KCP73_03230 [Salmonella enterica subsp. enterica]|nr:hypothetical protein KCP73_03230 [Salmonella enterica subsp. enterica]